MAEAAVTLVFTDIEGSSSMWDRAPEAMRRALTLHDAVLRRLARGHGGTVVKTEGDAFMLSFEAPAAALAWCLAAQEALAAERWPEETGEVRVRMGIHTGEAEARPDPETGRTDWFGPTVNRAARVAAAAHGGQVLASGAAWTGLTAGAAWHVRDLGVHRLRGLDAPERLVEVLPASLAVRRFEPPRTESPPPPLPRPASRFVGREAELAALATHLSDGARLLTLLGPGGSGKTRLALEYAWRSRAATWFCDLSPARTPEDLVRIVAAALDVPLAGGAPDDVAQLGASLAARGDALLVLDSFERLVAEGAGIPVSWLRRAPQLRVVITSRRRLRVEGEACLEVPPLCEADATALFRARATRGGEDAEAIAEIVRRLEGIPLAIELAAARTTVLSPRRLLERLGPATEGHGRTLRTVLEESWEAMQAWERDALAQLSVFHGGFVLEAAEAVVALPPEAPPVLDVVEALVDMSMLTTRTMLGELRFGMLGTIRAWARERLGARSGEVEHRRRAWLLADGEARLADVNGAREIEAFARIGAEMENLADAHALALAEDPEAAARLLLVAEPVHKVRGPFAAQLRMLDATIAVAERCPAALRSSLLRARADTLRVLTRREEARTDAREAVALAVVSGDGPAEAGARLAAAMIEHQLGNLEAAVAGYTDVVAATSGTGPAWLHGLALSYLAAAHHLRGASGEAASCFEAALRVLREAGAGRLVGIALLNRGILAQRQGRFADALADYSEGLVLERAAGNRRIEATALTNLGVLTAEMGRIEEAEASHRASLRLYEEMGARKDAAVATANLAHVLVARGRLDEAETLARTAFLEHRDGADRRSDGLCRGIHGVVLLFRGRLGEAEALLREALEADRACGAPAYEADALCHLVSLEAATGRAGAAEATLADAEAIHRRRGDPAGITRVEVLQIALAAGRGDLADARRRIALARERTLALDARLDLELLPRLFPALREDPGPASG